MNFKHLIYFLTVVDTQNFSKAANKLYISQQSLSEAINKLESTYNIQLFNRTQPLTLTYAGECFAEMASRLLLEKTRMEARLNAISNYKEGQFCVGLPPEYGDRLLPVLIPRFQAKYPDVKFKWSMSNQHTLEHQFIRGELDLIVGFGNFSYKEISVIHQIPDRTFLTISEKLLRDLYPFNLEEKRKELQKGANIADFRTIPFLLLLNNGNKCRFRRTIDSLFSRNGIEPVVCYEGPGMDILLNLSFKGMGAAFYPELLFTPEIIERASNTEERAYLFPLNDNQANRTLVIGCHENIPLTAYSQDFVSYFVETCSSIITSHLKIHNTVK